MKLSEIVIELSNRLADESDYEDNLQPKLQILLDKCLDKKLMNIISILPEDTRDMPCLSHAPDFDHYCALKDQGCTYYVKEVSDG